MDWHPFLKKYEEWKRGDKRRMFLYDSRTGDSYRVVDFFKSGLMRCDGKALFQLLIASKRYDPFLMLVNVYEAKDIKCYELKATDKKLNTVK